MTTVGKFQTLEKEYTERLGPLPSVSGQDTLEQRVSLMRDKIVAPAKFFTRRFNNFTAVNNPRFVELKSAVETLDVFPNAETLIKIRDLTRALIDNSSEAVFSKNFKAAMAWGLDDVVQLCLASQQYREFSAPGKGMLLRFAAQSGNVEVLNALFDPSSYRQIADEDKSLAFILAIQEGRIKAAQAFMDSEHFAALPLPTIEKALGIAIKNGEEGTARLIVNNDVYRMIHPDKKGIYLRIAAALNHVAIVELLANAPGYRDISNDDKGFALVLASEKGHKSVIETLKRHSSFAHFPADKLGLALGAAVLQGYPDIAEFLLVSEGFAPISAEHADSAMHTGISFFQAAQKGMKRVVRLIVESPFYPLISKHDKGLALIGAAREGDLDSVILIHEAPTWDEISVEDKGLALHLAATANKTEVVRYFLQPEIYVEIPAEKKGDAFTCLAQNNQKELIEATVSSPFYIEIHPERKGEALKVAAELGFADIVSILIAPPRYGQIPQPDKIYALQAAAFNGHTEVLKVFFESEAFAHLSTEEQRAAADIALQYAITGQKAHNVIYVVSKNGHTPYVDCLLAPNAHMMFSAACRESVAMGAALGGHTALAHRFLEQTGPAKLSRQLINKMFYHAAGVGHAAIVEWLIAEGAQHDAELANLPEREPASFTDDVEERYLPYFDRGTPGKALIHSARGGHATVAKTLLENEWVNEKISSHEKGLCYVSAAHNGQRRVMEVFERRRSFGALPYKESAEWRFAAFNRRLAAQVSDVPLHKDDAPNL